MGPLNQEPPAPGAMDLSPHFTLAEMSRSDTAKRRGIDNRPNAGEMENLVRLCNLVLEPARELLGVPLQVNSGFRSPAVNALVGGKINSEHLYGRACDFVPVGISLEDSFTALAGSDIPFNQLILEFDSWIHISVPAAGDLPKRQVLVLP